jgi:archaellum biogenesis ATPase FlaH
MIGNLTEEEFAKILHTHLSPSTPIQSEEHLYGRDAQIQRIKEALYSPGRTIFIYGDRGVGKTSLAQTVAFAHQSSEHNAIIKACSSRTTFGDLILQIADALKGTMPLAETTAKLGYKLPKLFGSAELEVKHAKHKVESPASDAIDINHAVALLAKASEKRQGDTVIVVDEFDQVSTDSERTNFADFIKQIGDQQLGLRFIFCGVAESLEKLLGAHKSCYRYVEGVEVTQLSWDAREAIIDSAADALKVKVGQHPRYRIAAISDGFPHYVHLVGEKLFWAMFRDPHPRLEPNQEHYHEAVNAAVLAIEQYLKAAYDAATMKATSEYEDVLWAFADHPELIRSIDSIFESYIDIMRKLEESPMDRNEFVGHLQTLKSSSCGSILVSNRRTFYRFRENILRGYVRLRAEDQGLELARDYYSASLASATSTWTPRGARKSRRGMTALDRARMNNPQGG